MRTIAYETAQDLFKALQRSHPHWMSLSREWIFRGHADAEWPLLPATLRPEQTALTHHPNRPKGPYLQTSDQIDQEIQAVYNFVATANYFGLQIPGVASTVLRNIRYDWYNSRKEMKNWLQFPKTDYIEAFALAQHHGIPTRLIDWSRSSMIATYFAASGAAAQLNEGNHRGRLGIWAFATHSLLCPSPNTSDRIIIVDPPRAENPNLLAQNGLFSLYQHRLYPDTQTHIKSFDRVVSEAYNAAIQNTIEAKELEDVIVLFTLPKIEARQLLVLLKEEDICAAKLFPGYDGIAREIKESLILRQSYRSPPEKG